MRFPESSDQKFDEFVERHRKANPPRHPIPPQPTWVEPPWQEDEEIRSPAVATFAQYAFAALAAFCAAVAIATYFQGAMP
jgi:hypothetical protein